MLSSQEVIHIQITSSAKGLTHVTQAADASRISTHSRNVQSSLTSVYPNVCHSVCLSVMHTHRLLQHNTHTNRYTFSDGHTHTYTQTHMHDWGGFWAPSELYLCSEFKYLLLRSVTLILTFCPEDPGSKQKANLGCLRTFTDLHVSHFSSCKMRHKEISFSPS